MCVKKETGPEMLRYYPMNREYAVRLAADERFENMVRERNRKHNKERWSLK